ncbi:MAG: PEP-CTERM system TPR-repeat protein PrsT [Rubrivivax sp.]|nr:PEP-CTERM system TPR-repeat protein PrsT [Rubrivivax sp.]
MVRAVRRSLVRPLPSLRPRLLALAAALLVAGCFGPGADELLQTARSALDREEYASAGIAARNLLKDEPESAAARFVLGRALYAAGDLEGAAIELERAQRFGHPDTELLPALAALRLAQKRPQEVVDTWVATSLPDAAAGARLRVLVAQAFRDLNRPDEAARAAAEALAMAPASPEAQVMAARVQADRGELEPALQAAAALVERMPDHAPGWVLQGDLLAARDPAAAVAAYRRALALRQRLPEAHFGLVRALIAQPDLAAAAEQVATMRRVLPRLPSVDYMDALVAFLKGEHARAAEMADEIIKRSQDDPALMLLAGMAQARLGGGARAESQLANAVSLAPGWVQPRIELAALQVGATPQRALETLQPLLARDEADARAWGLAGQAHARLGDFRAADAAFAKAQALQPDAPGLRAQAARSLIARGEVESGLRELQAAADADREGITADLALVAAHVRRGDRASALRVLDAAIAKRPDEALPHYLRGRVLADQAGARGGRIGRDAQAEVRRAYEQALAKDGSLRLAVDALAALDIEAGDFAAARQRYEAYLKRQPKSGLAMTALAEITLRAGGGAAEVRSWLDRAVQTDPLDPWNWIAAIDLEQRLGDPAATLARAQAAHAALPGQPALMLALARAQLALREANQAAATLRQLVQVRPQLGEAHLMLATAHGLAGNNAAARQPMARALALEPDDPAVLRGNIALALADRQDAQALAVARGVQQRRPTAALGWQLEAEVHGALGQRDAAAGAWRKAYAQPDATPQVAAALHRTLLAGGAEGQAAARQFEARHLAAQPRDAYFLTYLAEMAQAAGDAAAAERHYRRALAIQGDDPLLMNNLAALLTEPRPAEALALAERAVRLAPGQPALLDTLAAAQAKSRQFDRAVQNQLRAIEFAPGEPLLRLHLARIYVAQGDKDKARTELRRLASSGIPAPLREQAESLLREVGA